MTTFLFVGQLSEREMFDMACRIADEDGWFVAAAKAADMRRIVQVLVDSLKVPLHSERSGAKFYSYSSLMLKIAPTAASSMIWYR